MAVKEGFVIDFVNVKRQNVFFLKEILESLDIEVMDEKTKNNRCDLRCIGDNYNMFLFATHLYINKKEVRSSLNSLLVQA